MVSFMLVERSDVKIHIIHSLADDKIPFCPFFIIPYAVVFFPDWHNRLFCTVLFEQEGILSVYWHSGSGNDLVHSGFLCLPERTESSTGSDRGERYFYFSGQIFV